MIRSFCIPSIDDKVAFLSRVDAYPDCVGGVDVVETHMSWVFLVGDRVYKIKKPVKRSLVDFRSVDARYRNCLEEVRLNRRFGGDTYIGIEQLSLLADGGLALGRRGVAVDWLVVMHRLPEAAMLEAQIKAGSVDYVRVEEVAVLLARFFLGAETVELPTHQYLERLRNSIDETYRQLCDYPVSRELAERARNQQRSLIDNRPSIFFKGASAGAVGRLLDGHGDLRPEHVCLTAPPVVIDCLEFNRDLRIRDAVDELSFLAMECERLDNSRVGEILFRVYGDITGDARSPVMVAFYKAYRACERAKLVIWHLDDDYDEIRGRWRQKAEDYLVMATEYGEGFSQY
jgi:aminoglycoside phosphotransferase family enzyme